MKRIRLIMLAFLLSGAVGAGAVLGQIRPAPQIKPNQVLSQPPVITDVRCSIEGNQVKMEVIGSHFGATKGSRFLLMNLQAEHSIIEWSDSSIRFYPSSKIIFWDVRYSFAVGDGNNAGSNVFQKRIPWHISSLTPKSGIAGALLTLVVANLKSANDGYTVKFGTQILPVMGWVGYGSGNGYVRVQVPFGQAAGSYPVSLQKSGETASNTDQSFMVTIIK